MHLHQSDGGELDPIAVQTLFRRYWSSTGWRISGDVPASDFAYAKQAGVMFNPLDLTHADVMARLLAIRKTISPRKVADAFLASISSRRLDWRSALGSYSAIQNLPNHSFTKAFGRKDCAVCGTYETSTSTDISILNFERLKWGGVRHSQPLYAALDLEWFSSKPEPEQTENDLDIMRTIIDRISRLGSNARPGDAEKAIMGLFASNSAERRILIQILGLSGVLVPKNLPTYWGEYPVCADRQQPSGKNDWSYPVAWWRGSDGINRHALRFWFPKL
jgi:hypothetical protein